MERNLSHRAIDLEEYRKFVAAIAATADAKLLLNRDADQAAVVIALLLARSRNRVDFLTGELDAQVYGNPEVLIAAVSFLRDNVGAHIRILAERPIDDKHPLLDAIARAGLSARIHVYFVPSEIQTEYDYHFAVGDGCHFRFEPSRNAREAFVKFGDTEGGGRLQSAFDELHKRVEEAERAAARVLQSA